MAKSGAARLCNQSPTPGSLAALGQEFQFYPMNGFSVVASLKSAGGRVWHVRLHLSMPSLSLFGSVARFRVTEFALQHAGAPLQCEMSDERTS